MKIRKASELEVKKIFALAPQAILEGTCGEVKLTVEKTKELNETLLKRGSYYLVATENNEITG